MRCSPPLDKGPAAPLVGQAGMGERFSQAAGRGCAAAPARAPAADDPATGTTTATWMETTP